MPSWISLVLFAVVPTSIHALVHYYLWRRLIRDTGVRQPWRRLATIGFAVLSVSVPFTMWTSRFIGADVGIALGWPVFIWMGYAGLLLVGFLGYDIGRTALKGVKRLRRIEPEPEPVDPGRREFIARVAGGTIATATTGLTGFGLYEVLKEHEVREIPITLARLPAALDGFTIVQLTDIHVGYTVSRSFVEGIVERVSELKPDLIAITGDLVDGGVSELGRLVAPLGDLRAPHGVYFVTGNHEYYAGADPWVRELSRLGINVLRNERVSIGQGESSFDLAGVDDLQGSRFGAGQGADLARALAGRNTERELVLLAHQPRQVLETAGYGVGLQISGHTHGGQIWPWHFLAQTQQRGLLAGLSQHGETQLYISRGTGYWGPPMRIGAPAEISKIVLRAGSGKAV